MVVVGGTTGMKQKKHGSPLPPPPPLFPQVLALNPHHWGAASGAGMVHLALAQRAAAAGAPPSPDDPDAAAARVAGGGDRAAAHRDAALACLEYALGVHPRLEGVRSTAATLRAGGAKGRGGRLPWAVSGVEAE